MAAPKIVRSSAPGPPLTLAEEAVACVTLSVICGYYFLLIPVLAALGVGAYRGSAACGAVLALALADAALPVPSDNPLCPTPACASKWFDLWKRYFSLTIVTEAEYPPTRKYMFAHFPHGIYPMGPFLSVSCFAEGAPGVRCSGVIADVLLRTPGLRHLYTAVGSRSASKKSIERIFKAGGSVGILPGGIKEMFLADRGASTERIYLAKRFGFVKMAMTSGAAVVPIVHFGASALFNRHSHPLLEKLSRGLQASVIFFSGRFGLLVPFRQPMLMAVGAPVPVPARFSAPGAAPPTPEEVREVHAQVVKAVEGLYARRRPEWAPARLEVL